MPNQVFEYYTADGNLPVEVIEANNGRVSTQRHTIANDGVLVGDKLPDAQKPALAEKIGELYSSVRVYTTEVEGNEYSFEIGQVGPDDAPIDVQSATYSSSLTGNIGNGFEVARWALAKPDRTRLYVGSPAIGPSTPLTKSERRYLSKTGSLLYEDADGYSQPLPYVKAFARVLFDNDLDLRVQGLYSDSAGALLTGAYGASFGDGHIESSHQNARTGIRDKTVLGMAKAAFYDDSKTSKPHEKLSPDALKMSAEVLQFTRDNIDPKYLEKQGHGGTSLAMLGAYARGLGQGPRHGDPIVRDNIALARSNPDAKILFTVGDQDPFSKRPDLDKRMADIARRISVAGRATVSAVVVSETGHNFQTHEPQYLEALNKAILG